MTFQMLDLFKVLMVISGLIPFISRYGDASELEC